MPEDTKLIIEEYNRKMIELQKDMQSRILGNLEALQSETLQKVSSYNDNSLTSAYASLISALSARAGQSKEDLEGLLAQAEKLFAPVTAPVQELAKSEQVSSRLPEIPEPSKEDDRPVLTFDMYKELREKGASHGEMKAKYKILPKNLCAFSANYTRYVMNTAIPVVSDTQTSAKEYVPKIGAIKLMRKLDSDENRPIVSYGGYAWRINSLIKSGRIVLQEGKIPVKSLIEALKSFHYQPKLARPRRSRQHEDNANVEGYISPSDAIAEARRFYSPNKGRNISDRSLSHKLRKAMREGLVATIGSGSKIKLNKESLTRYMLKLDDAPTASENRAQKIEIYKTLVDYVQKQKMEPREALNKVGISDPHKIRAYLGSLKKYRII